MKYQNKSQLLSLFCNVTCTSVIISPFPCCHCHYHHHPTPTQAITWKQCIFSPSISCLNEAKPGTVDQNVMQSVDLPLLDCGPSDAMSSLVTAVIKIYRLIRKASTSYMVRMTWFFLLILFVQGSHICHRNTAFFKLFCLIQTSWTWQCKERETLLHVLSL